MDDRHPKLSFGKSRLLITIFELVEDWLGASSSKAPNIPRNNKAQEFHSYSIIDERRSIVGLKGFPKTLRITAFFNLVVGPETPPPQYISLKETIAPDAHSTHCRAEIAYVYQDSTWVLRFLLKDNTAVWAPT